MLVDRLQLPLELDELRRILTRYDVTSASVFGSYARGEAHQDSDLDLLVSYAPGTDLLRVLALQDELEAAADRKVDLVSAKFIRPQLAARIKRDLVPIF
jgi:uncharacterized protein